MSYYNPADDYGEHPRQGWTEVEALESTAERLRARADKIEENAAKARERAAIAQDFAETFPENEADRVVFFKKRFSAHGPQYTYSAVCYPMWNGQFLWASTGPKAPKGFTRMELITWLLRGEGVDELWTVTEFEKIV